MHASAPGDSGYTPHDFSCATATGGDDSGKCAEYSFYYEDDVTSQQSYELQISQPTTESATPDDVSTDATWSNNIVLS